MEVLLNDESLNGQYTEEEFIEFCKGDLIPILKELEQQRATLLKSYMTFSRMITPEKDVNRIIGIRGNPFLDSMRSYLVQLNREPFWDSNIRTDLSKEYTCEISNVPNCITEAYARSGMLLSLKDERFLEKWIDIICDENESPIRNITTYDSCRHHLAELGYIVIWSKNSFEVKSIGYKFEIRFDEGHHNKAHFHLSNADEELSISIPDADILRGETVNRRMLISWSLNNMKQIVELWNKIHPEMNVNYNG